MKLKDIHVHNFRSIADVTIEAHDFTVIIGTNNAGKSNILTALRAFYEEVKFSPDDFPKIGAVDKESWVELTFELNDQEWEGLADKYKAQEGKRLTVRRYFASDNWDVKSGQSNIHAIVNGEPQKELFYGAKNISTAKLGRLIFIPALTTPTEQMKTSGPSPLRDMLNFMFKKLVAQSEAYKELESAFGQLNDEARGEQGFLSKITLPINQAIAHWDIRFDMGINSVSPEDITKNLVRHGFVDAMLGDTVFALERYGHGFQRAFLYELIKLAPSFSQGNKVEKKDFDPDFTLILFEEPEAFLHPCQQENMAYHLRRLGAGDGLQVIITTHSMTFVGKAADDLCQLARVQRRGGISTVSQVSHEGLDILLGQGAGLVAVLAAFVDDPDVGVELKNEARRLLQGAPANEDVAAQEERFRYQLWLDSERASMFFAERVLLVEGATEKAIFTYLLSRDWHELTSYRIAIVDVMGKFNFHRYMALLDEFSVPYGLILDDDNDRNHHRAINEMLKNRVGGQRLADPVLLPGCLENFLGTELPGREDKKPVEILKAIEAGKISNEKLSELQVLFLRALALN